VLREDCAAQVALQGLGGDVGEARVETSLKLVLRDGCGERDDRHVDARGSHLIVAAQVKMKCKV